MRRQARRKTRQNPRFSYGFLVRITPSWLRLRDLGLKWGQVQDSATRLFPATVKIIDPNPESDWQSATASTDAGLHIRVVDSVQPNIPRETGAETPPAGKPYHMSSASDPESETRRGPAKRSSRKRSLESVSPQLRRGRRVTARQKLVRATLFIVGYSLTAVLLYVFIRLIYLSWY